MKYRIKNWAESQHYKDRNPPWMKLKVGIISSRDWVMWSDASRTLAIVCMVLATCTNGEIDGSPEGLIYLQKAGSLNSKPNLKPLIDSGFIVAVDASETLAPSASGSVSVSVSSSLKNKRPTLEEVRAYCAERGNRVDPEKWFHYYESNGWKVGKNPMTKWKAAIITWERSEHNQPPKEAHPGLGNVIV